MVDPAEVARIRAYLEQHKNTYTREALHEKLRADGYAPTAIEAAMAEVYGPPPAAPASPPRFRAGQALGGLALYGLLNLALYFAVIMTIGSMVGPGTQFVLPLIFALIVFGIVAVSWRQRSLAIGLIAGYALMSLLSGGSCTFFNIEGSESGLFIALFYYPVIIIVLAIGFAIYQIYASRRRS